MIRKKKQIYVNENNVSILGSSFFVGNFASRLQSGEWKQSERQKTPLWLKDDAFFNTIKIILLVYRSALSLARDEDGKKQC